LTAAPASAGGAASAASAAGTGASGGSSLSALLAGLFTVEALWEFGVLGACLLLAAASVRLLRGPEPRPASLWFGGKIVDGVLFPALALGFALLARWILKGWLPIAVFQLAVPVLTSLLVIRIGVRVLDATFPHSPAVKAVERTLSWVVWVGLVLWLTGVLPVLLVELEAIQWSVGGTPVSVRDLIEGALTAAAVMVGVLWLSSAIEARLLAGAGAGGESLSLRKIAANATRALLVLVGLLLALSAAGIPLGALSVVGGAVGVGIGFGLQKLAANYVSGFVILAERSLRIGDVVKVDNFEGRVTDIHTRYTVIRALNGRESIVPNEILITSRIENASLADRRVAVSTAVQVAYGTDVETLRPALVAALQQIPRVLADPAPGVLLTAFAADGLELTVAFWISDPEVGVNNVRSDVNLAILRTLNGLGVEIPFPQRVVRQAAA
jgi:small-conductance mechanosensitive channel